MARQLARCRPRAPRAAKLAGQLAQPLEALAAARPISSGRSSSERPARAEPLDQPARNTSAGSASRSARGRPVQLDEALDPFARLGRHLRRLGGGRQADDEVELAPARDLDHAREVDLAQLDRRARERAHDGRGVLRIDQQPHPGEHVAHLGPLQERPPVVLGTGARRPADRWRRRRRSSRRARSKDTRGGGRAQPAAARPGRLTAARLRSVGGRDRLGHSAADRRAGRRRRRRRSRPHAACAPTSVEPRAHDFAAASATTAACRSNGELPPLEAVDRPAWIAANLQTMRPLLAPLTRPPRRAARAAGRAAALGLRAPARRAGRRADGDALPARARPVRPRAARRPVPPRLLLLAPNLAQAAAQPRRGPRRAACCG